METFCVLLTICAGISPVPGEIPAQRPVTRSFDVFFDLCLNKRLSKQSWGWWFETPSRPLWRHRNEHQTLHQICILMPSGFQCHMVLIGLGLFRGMTLEIANYFSDNDSPLIWDTLVEPPNSHQLCMSMTSRSLCKFWLWVIMLGFIDLR